jgi:hypothetical protein
VKPPKSGKKSKAKGKENNMKTVITILATLAVGLAASTARAADVSHYSSRAALLGQRSAPVAIAQTVAAVDPARYNTKLALLSRPTAASEVSIAVLAEGPARWERQDMTTPTRGADIAASFNTKRALIGR